MVFMDTSGLLNPSILSSPQVGDDKLKTGELFDIEVAMVTELAG